MACLLAIQRVKIFSVGARAVGEEEAQPRWIRIWPCYYCCLFGVCACVCLYYFFHLTSTDPVALPAHWPIFISDGRVSPFTPNSRRPTGRARARAAPFFFYRHGKGGPQLPLLNPHAWLFLSIQEYKRRKKILKREEEPSSNIGRTA